VESGKILSEKNMADKDEIRIIIAQPEHRQAIVKLIETSFVPFEPIEVALGYKWEDARNAWEEMTDASLKSPCSHVAINSKNEVIGYRLSRIVDMEKMQPITPLFESLSGHIRTIADAVTSKWLSQMPRPGRMLQFMAMCVRPDYGGRGIAQKMCGENLALGKQLGCVIATVIASNWKSQRVFEKSGFEAVETFSYENFRDENGKLILNLEDPAQKCAKFYVKKLN